MLSVEQSMSDFKRYDTIGRPLPEAVLDPETGKHLINSRNPGHRLYSKDFQPTGRRQPWSPSPDSLKRIELDAEQGFQERQIAQVLNMRPSTFKAKMKEFPEIEDAIEQGRRNGITKLLKVSLTIALQDTKAGLVERDRMYKFFKMEQPLDFIEAATVDKDALNARLVELLAKLVPEKP